MIATVIRPPNQGIDLSQYLNKPVRRDRGNPLPVSEQRLALFAMLSESEADFRAIIGEFVCSDHSIKRDMGSEAYASLLIRSNTEEGSAAFDERSVLHFLDIGDAIKLVVANRSLFPNSFAKILKKEAKTLESLSAVRNRVMHQRPLEFDDLPSTVETLRKVISQSGSLMPHLQVVLKLYDNGQLVSDYQGRFAYESRPSAFNNLPVSDFEDTGFLGRREYLDELKKAISGPYPIITVLGDGGAGKSALALHTAYDFLADVNAPFDAIIWTTAKTSRLTSSDIESISGAIETSLGIAEQAACQFGEFDRADPFGAVKQLLSTFKVLLFIDNLETILDANIRAFVKDIPQGSKVVFTSRVGLGAYEYLVQVPTFPSKQAVSFFRRVSAVWRQAQYNGMPDPEVAAICQRLNNSPLGIKWFLQAVAAGAQPQAILANPKNFLTFCLENVVTKLSQSSRELLVALAVTGREQSPASLHFLTGIPPIGVENGLRELIASSLITVIGSNFGEEDRYRISSIAQTYVVRHHGPSGPTQTELRKNQAKLSAMSERAEADGYRISFDPSQLWVRPEFSGTDCVAATFLRRAMSEIRKGNAEDALGLIEEAKLIGPTFFEVLRVEAQIAEETGDSLRAQQAFEEALALRPNHPPLRVFYAQFLLRSLDDGHGAEEVLKGAASEWLSIAEIAIELARAFLYQQNYDAAFATLRPVAAIEIKSLKVKRKYFDILCQSCTRAAERAVETQDWARFSVICVRIEDFISELPQECLDSHLKTHLEKFLNLSRLHELNAPAGREKDSATKLITEVRQLLGLPAVSGLFYRDNQDSAHGGRVSAIFYDKMFGFIQSDTGERLFFHRNNLVSKGNFASLQLGDEVSFLLGSNNQGVCADKVSHQA